MRNAIVTGGLSLLVACGDSGSSSGPTCGAGTALENGMCVATGTGSGSGDVCGTGTHLDTDGKTCVPDGIGTASTPTIRSITPTKAGVTGRVLFEIDGTGFAGSNVTNLHVYFGDTTAGTGGQRGPCEAEIGTATATSITGEVPPACDLNVSSVTLTTNVGTASTAFSYLGVFAADGDGGDNLNFGFSGGDMYLIDPFAGLWFDLGPMVGTDLNLWGMAGIAFDSTAKLWGVSTGDSQGDADTGPELVSMSFVRGGVIIVPVGALVDANKAAYSVTDIKFKGSTLYGWGVTFSQGSAGQLVTIDTTTGIVTPLGTAVPVPVPGALVVDGTGTIIVAPQGAALDDFIGTTGEYDSADPTTGTLTSVATLDNTIFGTPVGAPINAMANLDHTILAVIDNGTFGGFTGAGTTGEQLAIIDPSARPIVTPLFELPAQDGFQSQVDALDVPQAGATVQLSLRGRRSHALQAAASPNQATAKTAAKHLSKYSH
jgi:IPT/TIG domain-containing protein